MNILLLLKNVEHIEVNKDPVKVSHAPQTYPYSYDKTALEEHWKQTESVLDFIKDTTPDINLKNIVENLRQSLPDLPENMLCHLVQAEINRQIYLLKLTEYLLDDRIKPLIRKTVAENPRQKSRS